MLWVAVEVLTKAKRRWVLREYREAKRVSRWSAQLQLRKTGTPVVQSLDCCFLFAS